MITSRTLSAWTSTIQCRPSFLWRAAALCVGLTLAAPDAGYAAGSPPVFGKIWLSNLNTNNADLVPTGPEDADFTSPAINYQSQVTTYTIGPFLNNPVFTNTSANWTAKGGVNASIATTFLLITGQTYLNAGSNSFVVAHDDGAEVLFPALGGSVVNAPGPTAESFTPFNVSAPTNGFYSFTVQYTECCGEPADLVFAINGQPVGTNSPPDAVCTNVTVVLGANSSNCTTNVAASLLNGGSTPGVAGDTLTYNAVPPGPYAIGTNSVTLWVIENDGLSNNCMAEVIVLDRRPPEFTCPADVTVPTALGLCVATNVALGTPVAATACSGVSIAVVADNAPTEFPVGTNLVTWTVTDTSGNTNSCIQRVIVLDEQPPTLFLPGELTALCSASAQPPYANYSALVTAGGSATDNCGVDDASFALVSQTTNPGPPEIVTRAYAIADINGNYTTNTQQVLINNPTPALALTGACPVNSPVPGQLMVFTGTVTNTGGVTLTNILINDTPPLNGLELTWASVPGSYYFVQGTYSLEAPVTWVNVSAAMEAYDSQTAYDVPLSETAPWQFFRVLVDQAGAPGSVVPFAITPAILQPNRSVATITQLAPGAGTSFTGQFVTPTNVCSLTDVLTATAASVCGVNVGMAVTQTCAVATSPNILITAAGPATPPAPGQTLMFTGMVTNGGNVALTNVMILNNQPANNTPVAAFAVLEAGRAAAFSGGFVVPADACAITSTLTVAGTSACGVGVNDSVTQTWPIQTAPALAMTRSCPVNPPAPGQPLVYSGTITNTGNIIITNIVITDTRPAANSPVITLAALNPGQGTNFSGSYTAPLNVCSVSDTLVAIGTSGCGANVANAATETCLLGTTPALTLTRSCPAIAPGPGQTLVYTGTVTNTGNISLTNIVIVDNLPAANSPVIALARLDPGQGTNFSGSYSTPLDACSVSDTLTATATSICGFSVANTAPETCPLATAPALALTRNCPANPPAPGQLLVYTGTVTNTGNIMLTNLVIVDSQPAANSPVIALAALAPGQGTNFSGSYVAPLNETDTSDTLTATATSVCGVNVTNLVPQTCPLAAIPSLAIFKSCPAIAPAPGQPLVFNGMVTNSGLVDLTNVVILDNQPGNNTPVVIIPLLAVGQISNFTGSYMAPSDVCAVTDTLTATGTSLAGLTATNTATATCPLATAPVLTMTRTCPANPPAPGQPLVYSGTVTNTGNIALTNIVIVDSLPSGGSPVITIAALDVGQGTNFSGSYTTPLDACSVSDTLTATATSVCGISVTNTAGETCPLATAPALALTSSCPANPSAPGQLLVYSGTVTNTGNIMLTNLVIVDSQTGGGSPVITIAALDVGQGTNFSGSYTAPLDACSSSDTLTATATSVCGINVTNTASETCPLTTAPALALTSSCPVNPPAPGQLLVYSGTVTNTGNILLTNLVIVDSQTGGGSPVITIAALDVGQGTNFSGSYTTPLGMCSVSDTLTATATSLCGISVTNTAAETCPVALVTAPALALTRSCPATAPAPGATLAYTGTVTNTGNIALTNIVIVNSLPTNNAPVTLIALLNPGQGTNFTGSYTATLDVCSDSDTLTATATSVCGMNVTNTVTQVCPLTTTPAIALTRSCPTTAPTNGQQLVYTGTITNTGNITLTNIVVKDSQSSGNLLVFGKAWLNDPTETNATIIPAGPEDADFVSPAISYQSQSNTVSGYTVGGFLNNPVFTNTSANWTANGGAAATVENTFLLITGQTYLNAGSNSFIVAHDDGVVVTFPALGATPVVSQPGPTPEMFTPFNVSAPTNGLYSFNLQYTECCGPPADLVFSINGVSVANTPVVITIPFLNPGQGASFTGSYTAPLTGCSSSDTLTATAISICGTSITNSAAETCPVTCH